MKIIYRSRLFKLMKKLHLVGQRFSAITLFEWVLTDKSYLTKRQLLHEERHVWQYRWHLYILFPFVYLLLLAIYKYQNHPYEKDARRYAEQKINDS